MTRRTTLSSAVTVPWRSASRSAPRQMPAAASPKTPERLGQQDHVRADLVLGHRVDRAAGGARCGHRVVAVCRVADRERARGRLRTDRGHRPLLAVGGGDRIASLRLGADQPRRRSLDQTQLEELAEAPSDLREQRSRCDRADNGIGEPPPQLLGDLERERLRALGVVRAQTHVDERPGAARTRARRSAGCSRRSSRAPRRSSPRTPRWRAASRARARRGRTPPLRALRRRPAPRPRRRDSRSRSTRASGARAPGPSRTRPRRRGP